MRHSFVVMLSHNTDVLMRVVGLFRRHGVEVESLFFSRTANPDVGCLEVTVQGEGAFDLLRLQLAKQVEVLSAELTGLATEHQAAVAGG